MRPQGKGPLESLYFTYPTFAGTRAPELDGLNATHKVIIAGAGPIGMTAALTLARYGIASVVLERKNTFNDGSRAICIARPSMQILEDIGAVAPFLGKALGWTHGRSYFRGTEIYRFEMPHPPSETYLPMYNLQQQYIEQYLWQACAAQPLIDLRWESEVTHVETGDGVRLTVSTPHGNYSLAGTYLLAADGARSAIRSLLGLRLRGENYEGRYVIADIRMAHDFPTERRAFFDPAGNPGGTVLIHKQPDNIWRIDYQLRDGESPEDAVREPEIRARVGAILNDIGHDGAWELEWWSIYTANTLCLDDYRHDDVFFIGDSAHIVPIFGVRGLNNGLADAFNIGWKLAYVLNGVARPALLDSYSPERRGATLDVFANAGKSTRFMTPPTRGWALMREAALSLALSQPFAKAFADPRQMQPYTYADSALTQADDPAFSGGARPGAAMPNLPLPDGGHLLARRGAGFCGVLFVDDAVLPVDDAALRAIDPQYTTIPVDLRQPGLGETCARLFDATPGTFYLLRPDAHVAGRWRAFSPAGAEAALRKSLGTETGHDTDTI